MVDGREGIGIRNNNFFIRLQLAKRRTKKIHDVKCPNVRGKNIQVGNIIANNSNVQNREDNWFA